MKLFLKLVDYMNRVVGYLIGVMLAVMSILVMTQIFTRFVINYPLHWTEELARYLMIYLVFLGAALALRQNRLIAIEALSQSVPPLIQRIMKIIVMILAVIFSVILLIQGIEIVQAISSQKSAGLRIPMSIPYFAIPLGALIMVINAIAVMLDGNKTEEKEGEETSWL